MPLESFNVYREQLSSLHQGIALWEPNPIKGTYDQVSIGDVGYVYEGFFYRMFNVTLPSNDPSNNKLGKPDDYTPLDCGPFVNIREAAMTKGDYCSRYVSIESRGDNVTARDPSDAEGNKYECRGQGALLSLSHDGHRKDVIRTKTFENYLRGNVAQWFAWSQRNELGVERMEDLILVSGCTLVTSWAVVAFVDPSMKTDISLAVQPSKGGARFTWSNIHGIVAYHNSHSGPDPPLNQCIFIRGFRAKRILFRIRPIRAAAEPLPDDPDNLKDQEDEIQVTRVSDPPNYRDPLTAILDYIAENCPQDYAEDTIAIAHDNDLHLIENVENMTASAVETFLYEHQIPVFVENGAATLREGEPPVSDDAKVVFYATGESGTGPVPLAVHPVLTEYLLRLNITGPDDPDYGLLPEEITSFAVEPPMLSLILENHQGYPGLIYIRASSGIGVTVEDVLRKINEELRTPLPKSLLSQLIDVEHNPLSALLREREQQGDGLSRFDYLRGRDRLQVLPKHPLEDTTPRRRILSSAESVLDEPSPLAAAPSFVDATPQPTPYTTTGSINSMASLLVDGYISQSFPNSAESYFCYLLKTNPSTLRQSCLAIDKPDRSGVLFVVNNIPKAQFSVLRPYMQGQGGYPLWLLDHSVVPTGTVVPQALWSPQSVLDFRQYVSEASLQMPIFFTNENGIMGLPLSDAANGRYHTLRDAREQAQLGGRTTTHIRISWPGYLEFKRQVQTRDETYARSLITIGRFAHHIGRSVEAFLHTTTLDPARKADQWTIGQGGVIPANIRVIGAVHVSAGGWMPILQLNNVWIF